MLMLETSGPARVVVDDDLPPGMLRLASDATTPPRAKLDVGHGKRYVPVCTILLVPPFCSA